MKGIYTTTEIKICKYVLLGYYIINICICIYANRLKYLRRNQKKFNKNS